MNTDPAQAPSRPLTPEDRRPSPNAEPAGFPVTIGEQTWKLAPAGLAPMLTEIRDRLYDHSILAGEVNVSDIRVAAFYMLMANYALDQSEAMSLACQADAAELASAVHDSFFGQTNIRRTWSRWATSSLLANGLRPDEIPADELPHVLEQLVRTKRAIPAEEYTEAGEAAQARHSLMKFKK